MALIDNDQLKAEIRRLIGIHSTEVSDRVKRGVSPIDSENDISMALIGQCHQLLGFLDTLPEQPAGEISDGYHTFNELYYYRMLYNAAFFNLLPKECVHKSKRHHSGEECFGGGWFIVMADLPTGQISNHYELKDWDLFQIPEKEFADEWDGHTPQEAAERLHNYLQQEQSAIKVAEADNDRETIEKYLMYVHNYTGKLINRLKEEQK